MDPTLIIVTMCLGLYPKAHEIGDIQTMTFGEGDIVLSISLYPNGKKKSMTNLVEKKKTRKLKSQRLFIFCK